MDDMLLETPDTPPPPAPAPPAAPPAAPPPPDPAVAAAPVDEVDLNEVDPKDEGKFRAVIAELSRLRADKRDLKAKADRVDQLEQWVNEKRPYVQVLEQNPGLLRQPPASPVPPPAAPKLEESPDALEAARLMDFYKPDGSLDAARGAKFLELSERRAQQIAQAQVAPLRQQTAHDKSAANFQRALATKAPNGSTPNPEILRALWQNSAPEDTANEQYASLLTLMALGADVAQGKAAPPTLPTVPPNLRPPAVTEAPGDPVGRTRASMSDLERSIAERRGISEQKWGETTKDYKAGRPNVLE